MILVFFHPPLSHFISELVEMGDGGDDDDGEEDADGDADSDTAGVDDGVGSCKETNI